MPLGLTRQDDHLGLNQDQERLQDSCCLAAGQLLFGEGGNSTDEARQHLELRTHPAGAATGPRMAGPTPAAI